MEGGNPVSTAKLAIMMVILMSAMMLGIVSATTHTVGGSSGWDLSSNLTDWSSSTSFFVNDSLVFLHSTQHNLIEVSKPEFDLCQIYSPIATYNNGDTVIFLNQPGPRYFVCSNHCTLGLKMQVQVLDESSSPFPSSSPLPSNSDSNSTTDHPGLPPIQLELPEISDHCNKHGRKRRHNCTQRGHPSNGYRNNPLGNLILLWVLQAITTTSYVIMVSSLLDIDYPKAMTITGLGLMINIISGINVLVCLAIAVLIAGIWKFLTGCC